MPDLLIRDVPDDVVAAIDADAGRHGLSRSEYLRRKLTWVASRSGGTMTVEDLARFGSAFADLVDDDVMRQAWR